MAIMEIRFGSCCALDYASDGSWIETPTGLWTVRHTGDMVSPLTAVGKQFLSKFLDGHGGWSKNSGVHLVLSSQVCTAMLQTFRNL